MTLTSQQVKVVYVPDGQQTVFPVPFPLFAATDVQAILVSGSDENNITGYTVEGVGTANVTAVFQQAPRGDALVLRRNTLIAQQTDYPEGGKFPAKVLEKDLDHMTMVCQEIAEVLKRAIKHNASTEEAPESAEDFLSGIHQSLVQAETAAAQAAESVLRAAESVLHAAYSADKAYHWASCPEDVPVENGKYSAYHWAIKAAASVLGYPLSDSITSTSSTTGASSKAVNTVFKMVSQSTGLAGSIIDFYGTLGGPQNKHPVNLLTGTPDLTYALCDGGTYTSPFDGSQVTTPDLRDKFILGAGDEHAYLSKGGGKKHKHDSTIDSVQVALSAVAPTINPLAAVNAPMTLTLEQAPYHYHSYYALIENSSGAGNLVSGTNVRVVKFSDTSATGSNGAHNHVQYEHHHSQVAHTHTATAHAHTGVIQDSEHLPPFVALYKIMKIA